MKRFVLLILMIISTDLSAQNQASKDWMIGLSLPVINTFRNTSHISKQLHPGISVGYKGITLNTYFSYEEYAQMVEAWRNSPLGVFSRSTHQWTTLFSLGYQHSFGRNYDSPWKPVLGAYLGFLFKNGIELNNFDFDLGLRYKSWAFLASPHIETFSFINDQNFPLVNITDTHTHWKFKVQYCF